jgi:hypothetical protein
LNPVKIVKHQEQDLDMEDYTREELEDILCIPMPGLHLQATGTVFGDGLSTRTVIPAEIWDKMYGGKLDKLYEGELTFSSLMNPEGDLIITTQLQTT